MKGYTTTAAGQKLFDHVASPKVKVTRRQGNPKPAPPANDRYIAVYFDDSGGLTMRLTRASDKTRSVSFMPSRDLSHQWETSQGVSLCLKPTPHGSLTCTAEASS